MGFRPKPKSITISGELQMLSPHASPALWAGIVRLIALSICDKSVFSGVGKMHFYITRYVKPIRIGKNACVAG